jgi:hypothetical protein
VEDEAAAAAGVAAPGSKLPMWKMSWISQVWENPQRKFAGESPTAAVTAC